MTKDAIVYHAIEAGLTVDARGSAGGGRVLEVGDEISITAELIESTRDARGESAFEDLTEAAQLARWRRVFLKAGPLESNAALVAKLEAEREAERAQLAQERRLRDHRYGRRAAFAED